MCFHGLAYFSIFPKVTRVGFLKKYLELLYHYTFNEVMSYETRSANDPPPDKGAAGKSGHPLTVIL